MAALSFTFPENVIRFSLEYETWRKEWKAFCLVDYQTNRKWYLGTGATQQLAIDTVTQNMLRGNSLDIVTTPIPPSINKGSMALDRIKREKEQNLKPLEDLF